MRKNFRTYELAVQFYHNLVALPCPAHLSDQLARAASSVALNLAEGSGRQSRKDQLRFYHIAFGSFRESQAALDLMATAPQQTLELADKLGANLYCLIKSLTRG